MRSRLGSFVTSYLVAQRWQRTFILLFRLFVT